LQFPAVSSRNAASHGGRGVSSSQFNIPHALPADNAACQRTVLPTEPRLLSVSNGETVSRSAGNRGKVDQLATNEQLSCSDVRSENFPVSVSTDTSLHNTVSQSSKSEDVEHLTEMRVHDSDETVTEMAVKHEGDAALPEYSAAENAMDDSDLCNGNVKDDEQLQFIESSSEVGCDVSENTCSHAMGDAGSLSVSVSELSDSVVDGDKLSVVSETADQEPVQTVCCEDVTEPHLSQASEPSVIEDAAKPFSTTTVCEEVDGTEIPAGVSDDGSCNELMEASVVSYVPEEPLLCTAAAGNQPSVVDDQEMLASCAVQQSEEMSSTCLSSDAVDYEAASSDDDDGPVIGQPVSRSHHSERMQFINSGSTQPVDTSLSREVFCFPEPLTTLSCPDMQSSLASCDLSHICATDTQQLPADAHVPVSSTAETYLQDVDAAFDDQYMPVDFTVGETPIADNTFRRCSLDMGGRGLVLSRIAEESTAGLAGDPELLTESQQQDSEYIAGGEYSIKHSLVILCFS